MVMENFVNPSYVLNVITLVLLYVIESFDFFVHFLKLNKQLSYFNLLPFNDCICLHQVNFILFVNFIQLWNVEPHFVHVFNKLFVYLSHILDEAFILKSDIVSKLRNACGHIFYVYRQLLKELLVVFKPKAILFEWL